MKLLLDTHVWIWSHLEPERLGAKVTKTLQAATTELWLSPISVWEFLLLVARGRVRVHGDPEAWVELALTRAPMRDATLTREIAAVSRVVNVPTDDPADRFLAATAQVLDLTLVTSDRRLLRGQGFDSLPAA